MDRFLGIIPGSAELQAACWLFPGTPALPEIPPAPLYQRGVGGDFREGSAKQDFLANFKIFHFDRLRDESRTFRTKPKIKKSGCGRQPFFGLQEGMKEGLRMAGESSPETAGRLRREAGRPAEGEFINRVEPCGLASE
jgi:hypothetical protein